VKAVAARLLASIRKRRCSDRPYEVIE